MASSLVSVNFWTSCDVRKPSKKWMKGTLAFRVAALPTKARSWASWTEFEARSANPVCRTAMTS